MYNNIPLWLRQSVSGEEYNIFCVHKDKVPIHGTHVDDMSTYHTFSECQKLMASDEGLGIGMFGNLCGIDIDHCIDNGIISPAAQGILDYFEGAYVEKSFSGTGIHLLFFCKEQHKYQKYYTKMNEKHLQDKGIIGIGGLELYQGKVDNRYLTLTGNIIPTDRPGNYTVSPEKIVAFLEKYFKRPVISTPSPVVFTSSDDEDKAWIKWALLQRKPDKLLACWFKHPTGSGGTESEDDLILCLS
jgi:putative DNA primase/helicase